MDCKLCLAALKPGEGGIVAALCCAEPLRQRLEDLGLIPGSKVKCLMGRPTGSPAAYEIGGAVIALRREDTGMIWLEERK